MTSLHHFQMKNAFLKVQFALKQQISPPLLKFLHSTCMNILCSNHSDHNSSKFYLYQKITCYTLHFIL